MKGYRLKDGERQASNTDRHLAECEQYDIPELTGRNRHDSQYNI